MTGVAQTGAMAMLNHLGGVVPPAIQSTAPTWIPGLAWVNTTTNPPILYSWNGVSWVTRVSQGGPYIALCTQDPTGLTSVSQLAECTDAGYARQSVTFGQAVAGTPVTIANTNLLQFGPFTVNMSLPVQWVALVTTQSGTNGFLLQTWTLSQQWQVLATQVLDIPAAGLTITQQ